MPYKVFISHSMADGAYAARLRDGLAEQGLRGYLAEDHPAPGTPLARRVQRAIQSHDAFVVILTPATAGSQWVNQEIGYAIGKQKPVVALYDHSTDHKQRAMLDGLELIPIDIDNPQRSTDAVARWAKQAVRADTVEQAIVLGALVGILVVMAVAERR